jgi:hypothetical protein
VSAHREEPVSETASIVAVVLAAGKGSGRSPPGAHRPAGPPCGGSADACAARPGSHVVVTRERGRDRFGRGITPSRCSSSGMCSGPGTLCCGRKAVGRAREVPSPTKLIWSRPRCLQARRPSADASGGYDDHDEVGTTLRIVASDRASRSSRTDARLDARDPRGRDQLDRVPPRRSVPRSCSSGARTRRASTT